MGRVLTALFEADAGARDFLLTENAAARARVEEAVGRLPADFEMLDATLSEAGVRESFETMKQLVDEELAVLRRIVPGPPPGEPVTADRAMLDASGSNLARLRAIVEDIQERHGALAAAEVRRDELTGTLLLWGLLLGSVVCAVGGFGAAIVVAGSVSRRARILARNADRLARGDALHSPPPGEDEIGQLDLRFREAASQLRARELELSRRTAQLEAANRELEAFSYSVSHDLRAPLRAIRGFSEVLDESSRGRLNATARDALRRVRAGAERMDALIDALIDLSRVTTTELKRESVDLSATSREIFEELPRHDHAEPIDIEVELNLTAEADPRLLRIALQNLIDNAVKYTARTPRPRIEVGSGPNGRARVFVVRDNGAGFSMQHADRLFSPFERLHPEQEFQGTGIGLAVVERVVRRHGGRVWAESTAGAGAAFFFTLEPEPAAEIETRD